MENKLPKCLTEVVIYKLLVLINNWKLFLWFIPNFESILKKKNEFNSNSSNISYTTKYLQHISYSKEYKLVCTDDRFTKPEQNISTWRCSLQIS